MYKITPELKSILEKLREDLQANKVCKAKIVAKYADEKIQLCDFDSRFWHFMLGVKSNKKILEPLMHYILGSIEGGINQYRVKIEIEYYAGIGFVIQASNKLRELKMLDDRLGAAEQGNAEETEFIIGNRNKYIIVGIVNEYGEEILDYEEAQDGTKYVVFSAYKDYPKAARVVRDRVLRK